MELKKEEMHNVDGGAVSWKILATIGAVIVCFVGILDGITNPSKCRNR